MSRDPRWRTGKKNGPEPAVSSHYRLEVCKVKFQQPVGCKNLMHVFVPNLIEVGVILVFSRATRRDSSSHVSVRDKKNFVSEAQSPTNHSPPWAHVGAIQHCAI